MKNLISYDEFWEKLPNLSSDELSKNIELLDPKNRSSAIFPVFLSTEADTRIQFLSYWLQKKENNIVLKITTRNLSGHASHQSYQIISKYKSNTILASELFSNKIKGFCGSIEIEFFSKEKPLYTFPAVSLSYANKYNSSVVHTCIRTYNKDEKINDYAINLPQTGFDVDFRDLNKNFICFFGGQKNCYKLNIELFENKVQKNYLINIKNETYGKAHILYLEDLISKEDKKIFKTPRCSIKHDFSDIFPRFFVGITSPHNIPTLTHTFFDTSKAKSDQSDLNKLALRTFNNNPEHYFDATFSIPIYPLDQFDTSVKSYSQNIEVKGNGYISFYSLNGKQLFNRLLKRDELSTLCGIGELEINKLIEEVKLKRNEFYVMKFAFVNKENPFPKRFKLGLNVKRKNSRHGTNICFSPLIMMDNLINKPFSRRWFPLGGFQKFVASIHNTSFIRKEIKIESNSFLLEFVNHAGESLQRKKDLIPNGSLFIDPSFDKQLNKFLGEKGGWCMVTANTFVFNAYYFSMTEKQIGGDHAY